MGDPDRATAIQGFLQQINDTVMHFGLVDIILVILVLFGLLRGYRKGFSVLLGNLLHIIFVITVTLEFIEPIASIFKADSPIFSAVIRASVFLALVIASYYVAKVVLETLGKVFKIQFTDIIDKVVGAFTGIAFFILLLSLVIHLMLMFSTKAFRKTFEDANMSGVFLETTAPHVHQGVRHLVLRIAGKTSETAKRVSSGGGSASVQKPAQVVYGQ